MLTLYANAKVSAEEAEVLLKAVDILVRANGVARKWNQKTIELTRIFHKTNVRAHIQEENS